MNFSEILRATFATFKAHKMRFFLTMFGIVWGIASVILLVGLGMGFSRDQRERWKNLGTDLVIVWGGRTSMQEGGRAAGRDIVLTIDDARLIKAEAYKVKYVSPELRRTLPQVSAHNSANRAVVGIWPEFQEFRSIEADEGRLITQHDEDTSARVVLLGYEARKQLFPGQPAVGQKLTIKNIPYTVVGVTPKKKQNSDYGGRDDQNMWVPYASMARDFPMPERPGTVRGQLSNIVMAVADPADHHDAVRQVRTVLGRVHHFDPRDEDALFIWDTLRAADMVSKIFTAMTIFFGAVAITTLCLGGIGVMNIMLVAVTERTREIGTRKALGATKRDILRQFFAESMALSAISGVLGFGVGVGISVAMQKLPLPEFMPAPVVSTPAIVVSIITLGLITFGAGMYPARRAAEMMPVDALRYE